MTKTTEFTHYMRVGPKGMRDGRPISSSTKLILAEAQRLGIEVEQVEGVQMFRLEYQGQERYFYFQNPSSNTALAMYLTDNKRLMRNFLTKYSISVPKGFAIKRSDTDTYLEEVYDSLTSPLVIKPSAGTQGKAITVGVDSLFGYIRAIKKAFNYSQKRNSWVIVEEQLVDYNEYRVLATRDKVIGVTYRMPANVVGDGVSNIRKLIKIKNEDPRRGDPKDHPPLFKLVFDDDMKEYLQSQDLTWRSIPEKGRRVFLRGVSNISRGGDSIDFTDKAHTSVKNICIKAIRAIPGLALGGVDFMTRDITSPQTPETYAILEINNSPGIDIHDYPYEGKNRKAGVAFLQVLFDGLVVTD